MQSKQKTQKISQSKCSCRKTKKEKVKYKRKSPTTNKQQNIKAFLCSTLMKSYAFCYVFPSSYVEVRVLEIMFLMHIKLSIFLLLL